MNTIKSKKLLLGLLAAGMLVNTSTINAAEPDHEVLFQPALLQSLTAGYYDGFITVKDFKKMGDTGIGTFTGVNGEMIAVDGHVYQALGDGRVVEAADNETIPFADVTFFEADGKAKLANVSSIGDMKAAMDEIVNKNGKNEFYMVRVDGKFNSILVRSELKQKKPYRTLAAALAEDQREFTYKDIKGTLVALYCPAYMKGINTPGWHLHFVSNDRKRGGHVLGLDLKEGTMTYDLTPAFKMVLPKDAAFNAIDLGVDQSQDIKKVEQADKASLNK